MKTIISRLLKRNKFMVNKTLLFKFITINIEWYDVIVNDDEFNGYLELSDIMHYYFWYDINAYSAITYDIIAKKKLMYNLEDYMFNIYVLSHSYILYENNKIHCYEVKKYPAPWECIYILSYLYKYLNNDIEFLAPEKIKHMTLHYKQKCHEYRELILKDDKEEMDKFQKNYLLPIIMCNRKYLCVILNIENKNPNKFVIIDKLIDNITMDDIYTYCITSNRFRGINVCQAIKNLY